MIPRRGLLAGLGALLAAPAIIRTPGLLMSVRPALEPVIWRLTLPSYGYVEWTQREFEAATIAVDAKRRAARMVDWRMRMVEILRNPTVLAINPMDYVIGTNRSQQGGDFVELPAPDLQLLT